MIELSGIEKSYGTQKVLNGVTLNVPSGSIFGLLGPNGAGKTTLISVLFGLIPPDSGAVFVDGLELSAKRKAVRARMGLVPQNLAFYPQLSARENLDFFASALGLRGARRREQIDFCVATTGLEKYYNRRSDHYSGGLKRRLNLAIGLLNKPRILCLDEPTVGIDPQSRNFILDTLRGLNRNGMTLIYTSHYMEEVQQICDEIAIIDRGEILVRGSTESLLRTTGSQQLEIGLSGPLPDDLLQTLPNAIMAGGRLRLETSDPGGLLPDLLARLSNAGAQVKYLTCGKRNLEQLFLELTQRTLRD